MVTMINQMTVHGDEALFRSALDAICAHMRARPGFLDLRLHRGTARPERWAMIAHWSDAGAHRAAATAPGAAALFERLRAQAETAPEVYETVEDTGHEG
ncbi:antibiotic biosynthesis monooxygenase family protein [Streptomyces sp. NPDC057307]|uniref:antibiotic biosynthesis monooxygenase family protein n=1 Tax=Streptomyces sp. NPDC057307 TaxID=3346096 RepID=UPI00364321D2